ncbi:MAG: hypothetical protein IKB38_08580 [Clostridia bacterium]|nr:hypothetical protein [Clostridia bacterium]
MKNKKVDLKRPTVLVLGLILLLSLVLTSFAGCGEEVLVNKTEGGLNFVIPDDFERTYKTYTNAEENIYKLFEYSSDDIGFVVDLIPYSVYKHEDETEFRYGESIKTCTEAIIDEMGLSSTITYNEEKKTAQFDTWVSDEAGTEAYYSYITILLSKRGIFVARYICEGSESKIEKYVSKFAEMSSHLSVQDP